MWSLTFVQNKMVKQTVPLVLVSKILHQLLRAIKILLNKLIITKQKKTKQISKTSYNYIKLLIIFLKNTINTKLFRKQNSNYSLCGIFSTS